MDEAHQLELIEQPSVSEAPRGCTALLRFRCSICWVQQRVEASCRQPCRTCPWREQSRLASTMQLIPRVPVRHWVYRPSRRQQTHLHDHALLRKATRLFVDTVFAMLRHVVQRSWPFETRSRALKCGGIVVVHKADAVLKLDPHFHALVFDGAYVDGHGEPTFLSPTFLSPTFLPPTFLPPTFLPPTFLPPTFLPLVEGPSAVLLRHTLARLDRAMQQLIATRPSERSDRRIIADEPSVRRIRSDHGRARNRLDGQDARCRDGTLHAGETIPPDDRAALVRVHRYLSRPVVDPSAFSSTDDGWVRLRLTRPLADGTTHVEFEPAALARRLAALAPGSAVPSITLHGLLAPRAAARSKIVPGQLELVAAHREPARGSSRRRSRPEPRSKGTFAAPTCCGTPMILQAVESIASGWNVHPELPVEFVDP